MALVYEKTWSQRYTDEQGVTWQLTDLEAFAGEVFERWQVLPQDEEPEPASKEATGGDKDEPTGDDKDEPTGNDDNEEPARKVPRLSSVTFYGDAA